MSAAHPSAINVDEIVEQVLKALQGQGIEILPDRKDHTPSERQGGPSPELRVGGNKTIAETKPGNTTSVDGQSSAGVVAGSSVASPSSPPSPATSQSAPATASPASSSERHDRQILRKRVITLADIAGLLPRVRYLVVPPRAVISPAVVDELAQRSITVIYSDQEPEVCQPSFSSTAHGSAQLYLEVVSRRLNPGEILRQLEREGISVSAEQGECLVSASERLAQALGAGMGLGVILTRHPPLAVCLANRHKVLRATWAYSVAEMLENVADIGANVLVLDFRKLTVWQMVQMLARFVRLGPQAPPWQELLPGGP